MAGEKTPTRVCLPVCPSARDAGVNEAFAAVIDGLGYPAGGRGIIAPDVPGDVVEVLCRGRRPSQTHQDCSILSTLAQTWPCSTNSPRSAAAMPRVTPSDERRV